MVTVFAAFTTAGCRSPTAGTHGACPEVSQNESAIDLVSALYAEPLCHNEPISQVGACIQEVVDLGSVLIGEHQARVLIVRRRIVGMASPRGMATVEVVSPGVNRIGSFRIDDASKIQLEDTGLLRIEIAPNHLKDLVGLDTALISSQQRRRVVEAQSPRSWTYMWLAARTPPSANPSRHCFKHRPTPIGIRAFATPVIEPTSTLLCSLGNSLPQQIHRYIPQELSATDIAAPHCDTQNTGNQPFVFKSSRALTHKPADT